MDALDIVRTVVWIGIGFLIWWQTKAIKILTGSVNAQKTLIDSFKSTSEIAKNFVEAGHKIADPQFIQSVIAMRTEKVRADYEERLQQAQGNAEELAVMFKDAIREHEAFKLGLRLMVIPRYSEEEIEQIVDLLQTVTPSQTDPNTRPEDYEKFIAFLKAMIPERREIFRGLLDDRKEQDRPILEQRDTP